MFEKIQRALHDFVEDIAPSPETRMRREAAALQRACCRLLMEVARLEDSNDKLKRDVVSESMLDQFEMPLPDLAAMIDSAGRPENRLTSYFDQVTVINARFDLPRKVRLVEQLWRVAMVDGDIDIYEDHLVRKLSELLYVPHSDFILAKNRVREGAAERLN